VTRHRHRMIVRRLKALSSATLACAICACGPKIVRFEAIPPVVCGQHPAVLRWDARGELAIAVSEEPRAPGDDGCASTGRNVLSIVLVARKGAEEQQRPVEVVQLHPDATEPVALRTTAVDGHDVLASGEKNLELWGSEVEIATLAACGHRAIEIRHAGKVIQLPSTGTASVALAGAPLGGQWEMRSPLTRDEFATPALRPKELKVVATLRCKQENR
jgi:hypothetical protein